MGPTSLKRGGEQWDLELERTRGFLEWRCGACRPGGMPHSGRAIREDESRGCLLWIVRYVSCAARGRETSVNEARVWRSAEP